MQPVKFTTGPILNWSNLQLVLFSNGLISTYFTGNSLSFENKEHNLTVFKKGGGSVFVFIYLLQMNEAKNKKMLGSV